MHFSSIILMRDSLSTVFVLACNSKQIPVHIEWWFYENSSITNFITWNLLNDTYYQPDFLMILRSAFVKCHHLKSIQMLKSTSKAFKIPTPYIKINSSSVKQDLSPKCSAWKEFTKILGLTKNFGPKKLSPKKDRSKRIPRNTTFKVWSKSGQ